MKERQNINANSLKKIDKTCSDCSTLPSCQFGKNVVSVIENLPGGTEADVIGKANAVEYVWFKKGNNNDKCKKFEDLESEIRTLNRSLKN